MKQYYIMHNVGKAKYMVCYHNGISTYNDESDFYDIKIFKNKKLLNTFIKELKNNGYTER
jgi:hypothetical protein